MTRPSFAGPKRCGFGPFLVALLVIGALAVPRDAYALFGWIEQLSGPGPFRMVLQFPLDRLVCVTRLEKQPATVTHTLFPSTEAKRADPNSHAAAACINDHPKIVKAFVSTEVGLAATDQNQLFPDDPGSGAHRVRNFSVKGIGFYRATPFLDLGAGLGVSRFSGRDFGSFYNVSIPLRARIVPAGFASGNSRWRAVYVSLQLDYYPADWTAQDFGAGGDWKQSGELITSAFLGVDLLRFLR
jgi:hypothetical protein